ncbi:hypothetical protein [Microseira sp. BLCC-F43]|jgi:peptidoglycan hydrolase CwlO-like protein|uniref:hypothetical protein n=1 Tax=Microseira sp. BLCC-F43 TaxID=3153602 RepID=UPI0035B7D4C4
MITQTSGDLKQATKELDRVQAELKPAQAELSRLPPEAEAIKVQNRQKTQVQAKADETEKLLKTAKTELKQLLFTLIYPLISLPFTYSH